MANELIINASLPETRIALMEDGEIQELLIERASGKGIVGNIYKGRVTRVLPGMQAAFVDIGLEKAAFLYVDDVYVHSELWEEEEETHKTIGSSLSEVHASDLIRDSEGTGEGFSGSPIEGKITPVIRTVSEAVAGNSKEKSELSGDHESADHENDIENDIENDSFDDHDEALDGDDEDLDDDQEEEDDDDDSNRPEEMGEDHSDDDSSGKKASRPEGTISPKSSRESKAAQNEASQPQGDSESNSDNSRNLQASGDESNGDSLDSAESAQGDAAGNDAGRKRHRRGRRGGRFRRKVPAGEGVNAPTGQVQIQARYPENYHEQVADSGTLDSDRSGLTEDQISAEPVTHETDANRPEQNTTRDTPSERRVVDAPPAGRAEFKSPRSRDRRIRQKTAVRPVKSQVNIQDLLKEGQEVLVQVAKDPIATKGARLTCHISLPGRHLVCMPTIDHVGVSRRIEREDERRRLREFVERNRPRNLGFIVRTASGKQQSEKRIKQDIDYLTRLWTEIKEKAATVTAPSLVYEDLNAVLRAIRDWVTEEIDKVIVDSRYHYNEIQRFVSHFMPPLKQKVELYHGDIPIFDAYGISTELSRALERKVWLKSGGYIVVDQAEALVAIDVNTGRYVGKKNLEDTILKTNLEAVQEIAYQLRLRNCGGIIILDLIDMEKDENKQRVYRALEDALSRDRARPTILKISELGLVEMTRKRTRDTIVRSLCESCTHCEGKGFIKSKQTVAYEVMREIEREGIERDVGKILVQAHPDVIDILAIDERDTLDQLERRYRKLVYLQAVTDFHSEQFEVTADKKEKSERGRDHASERSHEHHQERPRQRDKYRSENTHVVTSTGSASEITIIPIPVPKHVIIPVSESQGIIPVQSINPVIGHVVTPTSNHSGESQSGGESNGSGGHSVNTANTASQDGFYDEEDRLAFLRAQAAQDAALARLGSGHSPSRSTGDGSSRGGAGGPGAPRRQNRGRRNTNSNSNGGKFRRPHERGRERTPKQFGYGPGQGPNAGGGPSQGPKWVEPQGTENPAPTQATSENDSSGNKDGSGDNNNGSGGDHSQPPV